MSTLPQSSLLLPAESELRLVRKAWPVLLALGVALSALGVVAMGAALSGITTLVTILFFGSLLLVGGGVQVATAFLSRAWRGFFLHLLVGVVYLALGALMIARPFEAAKLMTALIAVGFLLGGLIRVLLALGSARFPGWGWVLGHGVVTLAMGVLIWMEWPWSAVWVIGLFVGIDLFSAGGAWVVLALALRRLAKGAATDDRLAAGAGTER
jgi:uncharacterized membrane protein HdeD (DUF308 family)